jgi:site-specific DNA-cytosine methylase
MKHNCGGTTVPKQREIVTRPDDNCWPRNNYIYVPYKALGNSMAVPVMAWIGQRIVLVEEVCAACAQMATS